MLKAMEWRDETLWLLDQRLLPLQTKWIAYHTAAEVATAIRDMVVRGAPAIGIVAAYGMALAAKNGEDLSVAQAELSASRPTAVNLFWALERIASLADRSYSSILATAAQIESEDLAMNVSIGEHGASLIPQGANILTICNTGSLATAGHGTALGVIRSAFDKDRTIHVWSCETRPRLQGLKLTAYELLNDGIPFHAIADGMAASLFREGKIDVVVAGADRIAKNGDTANKIGTYSLAVLAYFHKKPFYIAAPSSTIDLSIGTGDEIPIEFRENTEVSQVDGHQVAPQNCPVYNPGFDVTPGELICGIVTETGVFRPPYSF
jgi:methylthioribose-1-phosphate isomerase